MFAKRKLLLWAFFLVLVLLFFLFRIPSRGLIATYYSNPEWRGQPFLKKSEPQLSLETFEDIVRYSRFPQRNMSISWNGWIRIEQEGEYQFATRSDDGSSIIIDGNLVVDNGGFHGVQEVSENVYLTKGMHRININYFNGPGSYVLEVHWKDPAGGQAPIPSNILFPRRYSRYLSFLPRHPLLLYLVYPALWVFLLSISIGPKVVKSIVQNKREVLLVSGAILLCCLFIYLRYVCDPDQRLRTFLFFAYCFFLSIPCCYLIFRILLPEVLRIFFFIFYLFFALFPYKIFFPSDVDLCKIYSEPSTTLIWGVERYWVPMLYGVFSLLITLGWLWLSKRSLLGNTPKKELMICGVLLIVMVLQIAPRLDRNSPRMVGDGMHRGALPCDDDLTGKCVKEFFGYCVMCDVRHHTDPNGIFKGVDQTYSKWVINRRGLNAYLYALFEPFIHPYYASIFINGFFFYLVLLSGYTLAKYFKFDDTIAIVCSILVSANFLLLHDTVDTSFYIQKHAFPIFLLVLGYTIRVYSETASAKDKFLFCSVLACSSLVYTPFINIAFIFFWGLFHALDHIKASRTKAFFTFLHAIVYASIPLISLKGFEELLRHYHLEGYLDNVNVRGAILSKLSSIPNFLVHNVEGFVVRFNREVLRLIFENPVRNEYLAILGILGVICFFSMLLNHIQRDDLPGVYALYSSSIITPLIASLAAYIPPVARYAGAYTAPDRVSNYYVLFILAQSVGISYLAQRLCSWLPDWIKPKYVTSLVVLFIFVFSYHRMLFK